jgi:glucosamine-phosphate N-acetyltransferase
MEVMIREMHGPDLTQDFVACLSSLAEVDLKPADLAKVFQARLRAGIHTYVAVNEDKRVMGTVSLFIEPKFIHKGGKVGHIEDVAVMSAFRHLKLGQKLVSYATAEAFAAGAYKVILDCKSELVPFYERAGYKRVSEGMRCDVSL